MKGLASGYAKTARSNVHPGARAVILAASKSRQLWFQTWTRPGNIDAMGQKLGTYLAGQPQDLARDLPASRHFAGGACGCLNRSKLHEIFRDNHITREELSDFWDKPGVIIVVIH